jgi:hypothetical protein
MLTDSTASQALIAEMVDAGVAPKSILGPSILGVTVVNLTTGGTLRITQGEDGVFSTELRTYRRDIVGSGTMRADMIVAFATEMAAR